MPTVFFKIDAKTLQLKWTDIEIRKHVIPQMQQEHKDEAEALSDESVEDDLPPLDDQADQAPASDSKAPSPEKQPSGAVPLQPAATTRNTPVFKYNESDSEEDSTAASVATSKKVQYTKYTDLEELD